MECTRFKFRVWDSLINEYRKEGTIQLSGNGQPFIINGDMQPEDIDNVIIEQCTGLKDKNGKLIYEGDVVRYYRSTAMCLGGERIAQVLWDVESAKFKILTTNGDGYSMWEANRTGIEIIGNIHEMELEK